MLEFRNMVFGTERTAYTKTILSDLQDDWGCLREAILNCKTTQPATMERLIFHIDEAMSWERVRDLTGMKKVLIVIKNIIARSNAGESVGSCLEDVEHTLQEIINKNENGEKL